MTTPVLRVDGVSKSFGSVVAVEDAGFDISAGEVFALLGGSGSGKTTLLRMIAGFEAPSAGRVFLDGTDVTHLPPYLRPANMMFQSYALFPHMTVAKNVAYGLHREGMPRTDVARRVAEMLALVKLEGLGSRLPHQLSGGQQQRVALARALAKRPKLLLLDEPLGALDRKLREETQGELKRLQRELGIAFLIVTHDQEEAMTMADRIAVMHGGRIVQIGTPESVYARPGSRLVAEFLGLVNLIPAKVIGRDATALRLAAPTAGCELRAIGGDVAGEVICALRPEALRLGKTSGAANCTTATVVEATYAGTLTHYRLQLAGGLLARALVIGRGTAHPGDVVDVSWDADALAVLPT
jgi:putrescine transport system ATP-binding protein